MNGMAKGAVHRRPAETGAAAVRHRDASKLRAGRQALLEHLSRIEHRHESESYTRGQCGHYLTLIGEDVSKLLTKVCWTPTLRWLNLAA